MGAESDEAREEDAVEEEARAGGDAFRWEDWT